MTRGLFIPQDFRVRATKPISISAQDISSVREPTLLSSYSSLVMWQGFRSFYCRAARGILALPWPDL